MRRDWCGRGLAAWVGIEGRWRGVGVFNKVMAEARSGKREVRALGGGWGRLVPGKARTRVIAGWVSWKWGTVMACGSDLGLVRPRVEAWAAALGCFDQPSRIVFCSQICGTRFAVSSGENLGGDLS